MRRYLVSVVTPNYLLTASEYFDTLFRIESATPVVVRMYTDAPKTTMETVLWGNMGEFLPERCLNRSLRRPPSHSFNMIQHGRFLDAFYHNPEDLICLTDTDVAIQRDFTPAEWSLITDACTAGHFCASWNAGEGDTLHNEQQRAGVNPEWLKGIVEGEGQTPVLSYLHLIPCFNCGVLIATAANFRRLQRRYESLCDGFYANCHHRSRCQFLINLCLWLEGFGVALLPPAVHQHGHFTHRGEPLLHSDCRWVDNDLFVGDTKVLFRHRIEVPQ